VIEELPRFEAPCRSRPPVGAADARYRRRGCSGWLGVEAEPVAVANLPGDGQDARGQRQRVSTSLGLGERCVRSAAPAGGTPQQRATQDKHDERDRRGEDQREGYHLERLRPVLSAAAM